MPANIVSDANAKMQMQQVSFNTDLVAVDFTHASRVIDISTVAATSNLLRGNLASRQKVQKKSFLLSYATEMKCLEALVEGFLLADHLFLPLFPNDILIGSGQDTSRALLPDLSPFKSFVHPLPVPWVAKQFAHKLLPYLQVQAQLPEGNYSLRKLQILRLIEGKAMPNGESLDEKLSPENFFLLTLEYETLARMLHMPYAPHPLRSHLSLQLSLGESAFGKAKQPVFSKLDAFVQEHGGDVESEAVKLPAFFRAVINECVWPDDFLEVAAQMRESRSCREFRLLLSSLDADFEAGGGGVRLKKVMGDIDHTLENLSHEIGIKKRRADASVWLLRSSIALPSWLSKEINLGSRAYLRWIRRTTLRSLELTSVERKLWKLFG